MTGSLSKIEDRDKINPDTLESEATRLAYGFYVLVYRYTYRCVCIAGKML